LTAGDNTLRLLDQAPPFQFELAESRSLHAKQRNDARLSIAGLALLVAITIVSVFFVLRQQATAQVHTAQARSLAQIARWQGIEGDDSDQAAQLGQLQSDMTTAFHPGQRLSDISAFVSDSLPKNAWLTGLTLERAKQVQVRGTALSADQVADFVDALGSSPRFANVKLIFANSAVIGTTQVIEFNVTADCVGNLPMPTAPSKEQGNEQTATSSSANSGTGDGG
jgi:Tfp pilus assembly protein PilN